MPEIGEVKKGGEIEKNVNHRYIWQACLVCGKQRWVQLLRGEATSRMCHKCFNTTVNRGGRSGKDSPYWKGGRIRDSSGYILILLQPDDFFYPMTDANKYVLEHRLIMARHLGRCLQPWEIVHHRNHLRDDNRIENLGLMTDAGHKQITHLETILKRQQGEIEELKAKVKNLEGILKIKEVLWEKDSMKS